MVARTWGWLQWCRRLSKDYEVLAETSKMLNYGSCDSHHDQVPSVIFNFSGTPLHPLGMPVAIEILVGNKADGPL